MLRLFAFLLILSVQIFAEDNGFVSDCSFVSKQGVYHIQTDDGQFDVFCDDDPPDGGWVYVLNRNSGKIHFHEKTWEDYKKGFGQLDLDEEYFIGLEKLHFLTKYDNYNLLIKMQDFDGNSYMTQIFGFHVAEERLRFDYQTIDGYEGTEIGIAKNGHSFCAPGIARCRNARDIGWFFDCYESPRTNNRLNLFGPYPKAGVPTDSHTMGFYNEENDVLVPLRSIKILMRKKKILFNLSEEVVFKRS